MKSPVRFLLMSVAATVFAMLSAVPADAALLAIATTEADDGEGNGVQGRCVFGLGVLTDSHEMTISFTTLATPTRQTSAKSKVAVATGVRCRITDGPQTFNDAGITLPGPAAATAGTARMPRLTDPILGCISAFTAYHDGTLVQAPEKCWAL